MRARGLGLVLAALLGGAPSGAQRAPADAADARLPAVTAQIKATETAMMSDPAKALVLADRALAAARALSATPRAQVSVATAEWLKGWALITLNQTDKAQPLIADATAIADRVAPRTRLQGDLLRSRGVIAEAKGRMQEALQCFQQAFAVFAAAHEPRSEAIALEDIGQIYKDAGDYRRALRYYAQIADIYRNDRVLLLTGANDRGELLQKLGRDREAEEQYKSALHEARGLGGPLLETRVLLNLAPLQANRHELAAAAVSADRVLQLTRTREAAAWHPFALGAAAVVADARGDVAGAGRLLDLVFAGVDLSTTDPQFRIFHRTASQVYERLGRPDLALAHLRAYYRLEDDARDVTASFGAQLVSARFDFANQNLRISRLQRGQLERDIRIEQQHGLLLKVALGAGAVVFAALLFGFFSVRRSRNEVRAANATLTVVNTRLEAALAAKARFLATTSHEIRTPLNGILGMTQVLLAQADLGVATREKVEIAHGAGETMRTLVDDLLDVAKMETGKVTVVHAPARPLHVLADATRLWRGHAETKGLWLTLDTGDVPATILSDEGRLRQIVSNLLSNAVKFTQTGGVAVCARVEATTDGGETLRIAVRDTGVGIPADQQPLVFEPFHQVDSSITRQFAGTGLGLAICRSLAEALGGTLQVESQPGIGTSFVVRVPLERVAAATPSTTVAVQRAATLADARVLLVEANPLTQGVLRALLESHVGAVEAAGDGDAALAALANGGVHHLLLDAASARVGDLEPIAAVRALLRAGGELGAVSTLLVSANGPLAPAELAAAGASQIVIKPVAGAALLARMRELYAAPVEVAAAA